MHLLEHDSQAKQLYQMVRRAARIFASGYASALIDEDKAIGEQELALRVMNHIRRVTASLAEQFGIDWTRDDIDTIELDVREICINKYKPF